MKSEELYKEAKIVYWLLNGSKLKAFLKVMVLFLVITGIGFIMCYHDNAVIIDDAREEYVIKFEDGHVIDTIKLADNSLFYSLKKIDTKQYKLSAKLRNTGISKDKQEYQNKFIAIINFKRTKSDTLIGNFEKLVLARKVAMKFKIIDQKLISDIELNGIGYAEDYGNYLLLVGFFIMMLLFKALSNKFIYTFSGIDTNSNKADEKINFSRGLLKVVKFARKEEEEYEQRIKKYCKIISLKNNKWYKVIYLSIAIIITTISIMTIITPEQIKGNWNFSSNVYFYGFLYNQIKDIFLWVIIFPQIGFRTLLIAWYTIKISNDFDEKKMFDIKPFAPDKAGGLAPLGELTLMLFYIPIAFLPHFFATTIILGYPFTHKILYPVYFVITFYLFFFPLNSPHKSMKDAKLNELDVISERYNKVYELYKSEKEGNKTNNSKELIEEMEEIKDLYQYTEKMPVWPFDLEIFIKFGAIFFTSLTIYLTELIINLIR